VLKKINVTLTNHKLKATIIGIVFTFLSLLLYPTGLIPIYATIPLRFIRKKIIMHIPDFVINYKNLNMVYILSIFLLVSIILFLLLYVARSVQKANEISNMRIILIMVLLYFIFHTLGFYIYEWYYTDDIMFYSPLETYLYSSILFIPFGLVIDILRYNHFKKCNYT
jgi:hypothetical protein